MSKKSKVLSNRSWTAANDMRIFWDICNLRSDKEAEAYENYWTVDLGAPELFKEVLTATEKVLGEYDE